MSENRVNILSLAAATVLTAASLYSAVLLFISLARSGHKELAYGCGVALAVSVMGALQKWLVRNASFVSAATVNTAVWLFADGLITFDGVAWHPGLAKDVEISVSGLVAHLLPIIFLSVLGAAGSTAVYLLLLRKSEDCVAP